MSIFFNPTFYLQNNPDVLQAVAQGVMPSAEYHFNNFGWKEGRSPNATFDVDHYLINNPDVLAAGVNPLTHFIEFGAAEGRSPSAEFVTAANFDTAAYAAANADLAAAGITTAAELYEHFAKFGFAESRPGVQTVDGSPVGVVTVDNVGQTFTLTHTIDNLTGTANDDTFVGDDFTVSAADQIDGKAGNDTFNYFGAKAAVALPQMQNIETLNLINPTATTSLNTSAVSGLTAVNYKDAALGAANLAGITLAGTQTLGLDNVQTTGDLTADFGTSATAASLKMSNGSSVGDANLNGTALKTLNIDSAGSKANTIATLASTGTEDTVNLSGSQKLTITNALANSVKTVDASKNEGGVTVTAGNADVAFTGGAGDDSVNLAGTYTTADVLNGGDGTDTLVVNVAEADPAAAQTNVTNFEVLAIADNASNDEVDAAKFSVNKLEFRADSDGTTAGTIVSGLTSGATIITGAAVDLFGSVNAVDVNLSDAAGAGDSITIDINNTAGAGNFDIDLTGVEKITIDASGSDQANNVDIDSAQVKEYVVNAGGGNLTLTTTTGGTVISSVDASSTTGDGGLIVTLSTSAISGATVTGTKNADTVVGSNWDDDIISGAGNDIITGRGGNDEIDISGGGSNTIIFENSAAGNGTDTITGFNAGAVAGGGDVLDVTLITPAGITANVINLGGAQAIANNNIFTVNFSAAIDGKDFGGADFADLFAAAGKAFSTTVANNDHAVIVVQGTDKSQVYYVDNGADVLLSAADVALVGVLDGVTNANTFVAANFA
jgi:hypothetical protein